MQLREVYLLVLVGGLLPEQRSKRQCVPHILLPVTGLLKQDTNTDDVPFLQTPSVVFWSKQTETAILSHALGFLRRHRSRAGRAPLSLLNVSAAFETVDHDISLERLSVSFGVSTGQALDWIRSFLSSRLQSVCLGSSPSPSSPIRYGSPKVSILGPKLYIIYTADVERVVKSFGVAVQLYADDTQHYGNSLPMDAEELSVRALEAISAVESWMSLNRLRLKADKTQFIWFGTRQQLAKSDLASLASISPSLTSSDLVHDLGVLPDSELTMDAHIKQLCRSCFYQPTKVAGHSALSVEKVPADPCVRVHLQSNRLLQPRPLWSYCEPSWIAYSPS